MRWQCGNEVSPAAGCSQLRVLYRSSSSGLDWPKSIMAGSGLKPEPPGGQREKCNEISVINTEILHVQTDPD